MGARRYFPAPGTVGARTGESGHSVSTLKIQIPELLDFLDVAGIELPNFKKRIRRYVNYEANTTANISFSPNTLRSGYFCSLEALTSFSYTLAVWALVLPHQTNMIHPSFRSRTKKCAVKQAFTSVLV